MPTISIGSPAPAFSLRDSRGEKHTLADYRGRFLVLYFYPEDDTPLCTAQACQLRDHFPDFSKIGCTILGVSPDGAESHAAFIAGHKIPFPLLVDEKDKNGEPRVSMAYGAWGDKNMYGNIVRAMLRTTYLIGPDGRVAQRWDRVKTPGHAAKVLAAVKALHSGEKLTILGEPRPLKSLSPKARKPSAKRSSQRTGRAAYSGVRPAKGKNTPVRASAPRPSAPGPRSRPTPARTR